ncbi:MAG: competence/damage-inducible protein [Deltaproteobacteria bacterium]|nr:competence/damage-inducible protein [Deltaproteobacteria bacterium]
MDEVFMRLEKKIGRELSRHSLRLCTAESCTGGLVAGRITNASGASGYFEGGFITYSNTAKNRLIGVPEELIGRYGAVSDETARRMAEGAREKLDTDMSVAVTGIAGPTGGTPDKPVGTVYIAVARKGRTSVRKFEFTGTRHGIRKQTADEALKFVLDEIEAWVGNK